MNTQSLTSLLEKLVRGEASVADVASRIGAAGSALTAPTDDAHVDLDRQKRCGFPEVVYGAGKTEQGIVEIFQALLDNGQDGFGTRISPEQAQAIQDRFHRARYNAVARTIRVPSDEADGDDETTVGRTAVISAGTSDRPVAEEAVETLRWMRCEVELIHDVGVAGPHRLQQQRERFADRDALVVVAGMEGALPSVVGGCVDCPVVAVPTSVGYGASFGGTAALLGMLNSCAANVTVVNIDAGFKGGYVAGLIARKAGQCREDS